MMLRNRGIFATIARGALLAITCCAAVAQTPVPATLDLRVAATPAATTYLNGARPIARQSAKGVTSYAYKNGWPVLAVRTDGTYAEYKYLKREARPHSILGWHGEAGGGCVGSISRRQHRVTWWRVAHELRASVA